MRLLLRLSALLAVAALVAWVAGAQTTVPIGPRPTPPPEPSYPLDGAFVYQPDPHCPGSSNVLPDLATAVCMRAKATEYLINEISARRLEPGPAWTECNGWSSFARPGCVAMSLGYRLPEIRFGQSAVYLKGNLAQVETWGCFGGVAYERHILVSLHDGATHAYTWTAWETGNSLLRYTLDLGHLTDGSIPAAATRYAAQACGVQ